TCMLSLRTLWTLRLSSFTTRRTTRATLSPYTTLFRSAPPPASATQSACWPAPLESPARRQAARRPQAPAAPSKPGLELRSQRRRDRKSTRLNSSHVKISYAVFCLKQKIIAQQISDVRH